MTDTITTTAPDAIDESRVEEFAEQLFGLYTGGMLTYMIDIGHRTGLFECAAEGPGTSAELAARAGLEERYVREWLGAMVTGRIVDYDAQADTYHLPAEHAVCLTGSGSDNLAPFSHLNTHLAKHVQQVAEAFREGGGVSYVHYRPEFTEVMDGLNRGTFDELLLIEWLPLDGDLPQRLAAGARVADVGCGTGHALVLMAGAYPASTFVGYDLAEDAIAQGRAEAEAAGLTNIQFEVQDVAALETDEPFDVIFAFDAIHDQAAPDEVLRRIHRALVPGGRFFMVDIRASSNLEDNLAHPFAPFLYSISTLHCMTVSLAHGGPGLGTVWGEQRARQMLREAGFAGIEVHEAPGDPIDSIYLAHRPG